MSERRMEWADLIAELAAGRALVIAADEVLVLTTNGEPAGALIGPADLDRLRKAKALQEEWGKTEGQLTLDFDTALRGARNPPDDDDDAARR